MVAKRSVSRPSSGGPCQPAMCGGGIRQWPPDVGRRLRNGSNMALLTEGPTSTDAFRQALRGYFPFEEEATSFGQIVLELIVPGLKQLPECYEESLEMVNHYSLFDQIGPLNAVNHEVSLSRTRY
jgi:hypothetical protein